MTIKQFENVKFSRVTFLAINSFKTLRKTIITSSFWQSRFFDETEIRTSLNVIQKVTAGIFASENVLCIAGDVLCYSNVVMSRSALAELDIPA